MKIIIISVNNNKEFDQDKELIIQNLFSSNSSDEESFGDMDIQTMYQMDEDEY